MRSMYFSRQITRFFAFALCLLIFGCAGTTKVSTESVDFAEQESAEIPVYEPTVNEGVLFPDISNPEQLTFGKFDNGIGNIHPDGDKIVYQSFKNDKWQLWEMNFSESSPSMLLEGESDLENPIWSNDGSVVLYVQTEGGGSEWDREIYMYDPVEEVSARLTNSNGDDWFPVIVDESNYIFMTERDANVGNPLDRSNSIYMGSLDGTSPTLITDPASNFSSPAFVDKNRLIVLTAEARLAIYNNDTDSVDIITPSRLECGTCDYSNSAGMVVFTSVNGDNSLLYIMDIESRVLQEVSLAGETIRYPRFSPDGNWLLYSSLSEGHFQLFRINLSSS
jgi:Tol biopolymer transport system component